MPLRWHVNLPGPVAYSRPIRKRRGKKPGLLTSVLVWFIVKPLELIFRGGSAVLRASAKPKTQPVYTAYKGAFAPPATAPGWYHGDYGWFYWNGQTWYDLDGRTVF